MDRRGFFKRMAGSAAALTVVNQESVAKQANEMSKAAHDLEPFRAMLPSMVDRRPYLWYDQFTQSAGSMAPGRCYFFATPLGQLDVISGLAKTSLETNMLGSGGNFPPPMSHVLQRIGFLMHPDMCDEDIAAFSRDAFFEFRLLNKRKAEGRLDWLSMGPKRGQPADQYVKFYQLDEPILIASLMYFSLEISFIRERPVWKRDIRILALLDGISDFAIQ